MGTIYWLDHQPWIKLRDVALFSFSIKGPGSLEQPLHKKKWHEMLCHLVARTKALGSQVRAEVLGAHLLPSQPVMDGLISHLVTGKLGW